jgi:ribosomal protein S12 methylthiotransferase accessory factor
MKTLRSPLHRLFDVVDYLVDDHVGVIRYVREGPREPGAPDFFHFHAQACNTSAFSRQQNSALAGGASADRGMAMAKAIGEAVERYCSALYEVEELPLMSFEAASFPCVPPCEFALYSQEQYMRPGFPYVPFANLTPVRWTPALDPLTGETWHIPAAMVFMPYYYEQERGERPIAQPMSTGLACHCSPTEAAISAICEVIERDAFTITWQARLGMPQVLIETLSDRNRDLVARFERTRSSVTVLNITVDVGVPTILSVLRSQIPAAPALVFAAATAMDPEHAVRKSLEELALTHRFAQQLKTNLPHFVPTSHYDNVVDQERHVHVYCDHANTPLAEFIFASDKRIGFEEVDNLATGDPQRDLEILLEKVRAINHRVLISDLTTPDVQELGLAVVRAVIPGFHPLFIGHGIRALGGSRLWEVPQKLGYKGITRESGDNPAPHPYP